MRSNSQPVAKPPWIAAPSCRNPRRCALVLNCLLLLSQAMAQEADTFSKVVSYRFDEVMTASAAEGGVQSVVVSYLFEEDKGSDTASGVQSPVVSYLYHDWLGDDQVAFQTSAPVSYAFAALAAPAGIAPGTKALPGPTITTLTPSLSWKAVKGTEGYGVTVSELTTGAVVYQNLGLGAVTAFTLPAGALYPGYHYAWRVRASRSGEWSADSAALYFGLPETVPVAVAPTLVSPGTLIMPGPPVAELRPTFIWKSVANVVAHELAVTDVITSATVFSKSNLGRGMSYTPETSILQSGHAYRWRVRASNGQSWGAWSQAWHFQTVSAIQPPAAPAITAPGNAKAAGPVLDAAAAINFAWKAVKGTTAQALLIADADSGAVLHEHSLTGDAVGYALPAFTLTPGAHCWWNLRVQTAQGLSDYSTRLFFQTKPVYPAPVIASLQPTGLPTSTSAQTMELSGTGFRSGAQVLASYAGKTDVVLTPTLNSDRKLTLKLVPGTKSDTWTLKVRNTDGLVSNAMTFAVTLPGGTLLAPTASQPSAVYVQPVLLTLSSTNPAGTEIHYTTDGSTPTRLSPLYTVPLFLGAKTVTIKALCTSATMNNSPVLTQSYVFNLPIVKVPGDSPAVMLAAGQSTYFKLTLPADVASFSLESVPTTPALAPGFTLKMSLERLPVDAGYDWVSVVDVLATPGQIIKDVAGTPKTFFVLAQPDGPGAATAKLRCSVVRTDEVTPPPTISPTSGKQYAPLTVTLGHSDWSAAIYYTLDGTDPEPFELTNSSTHAYLAPFTITTNTTVKVRALMLTKKRMSPVVSRVFELLPNNPNFFVNTGSTVPSLPDKPERMAPDAMTWEVSIPLKWSSKEDVSFSYKLNIPADPVPETEQGQMTLRYPVALTIENLLPGYTDVYVQEGGLFAIKSGINAATLPNLDGLSVLGPIIGGKGQALVPGQTYVATVVVRGTNALAAYVRNDNHTTATVRFKLHFAELQAFKSHGVLKSLDNTWLSIHGREASSASDYIVNQSWALGQYFDTLSTAQTPKGQALRVNWGSMSASWAVEWDQSIYTQAVGVRTADVLKRWEIIGPKLSMCGHSWGAHVAYFIAKELATQRVGMANRLIACDPAGKYVNKTDPPDFGRFVQHSWSFYAAQSYDWAGVGSAELSATAQEAFILATQPEAGSSIFTEIVSRHKAPFQLFTHFLEANYGTNTPLLNQTVAHYFTIDALDHKTGTTPFRANQWAPVWSGYPAQSNVGAFEGSIVGKLSDQGLDATEPLSLHYLQSGSISTTPVVVPTGP